MKNQTLNKTTVTSDNETKFVHHSDGTELIPAEIHSDLETDDTLASGSTIDDEGLINNYAVEPDMSAATYPNPQQQSRYIVLGVGATLFVAIILLITFAVS